jgi:hypothetical protein
LDLNAISIDKVESLDAGQAFSTDELES